MSDSTGPHSTGPDSAGPDSAGPDSAGPESTRSEPAQAASSAPAGWYTDPAGSGQLRWWDGAHWTEHVHPVPDAAPARPAPVATTAARPGAYTWYIWAIALLPLLSVIALGFFDLRGMMLRSVDVSSGTASPMAGVALLTDPGYLAVVATGWVVYAATVVLAFLDWRALQHAAIVRPFHWAWAFLGGWVYVIGRCVVVKSRTGRGLMPIWVMIAVGVLAIIVVVVKMVDAVAAVIGTMPTSP